jgi:hypothetical protein
MLVFSFIDIDLEVLLLFVQIKKHTRWDAIAGAEKPFG